MRLARFSYTMIVLNHAGLPSDRSSSALAGWHAAMREVAEEPNVRVKISGLGQPGRLWSVEDNAGSSKRSPPCLSPARNVRQQFLGR